MVAWEFEKHFDNWQSVQKDGQILLKDIEVELFPQIF